MSSRDVTFHMSDKAVATVGEGTGREVLVNPYFNAALLLDGWPTAKRMLALIDGFEQALYPAVKSLLKARRGDITMDREDRTYDHLPYYFTGHWTTGKGVNLRHGERRYVFSIANTGVLRIAAGLSGGGPCSPDYVTFPNEKVLDLAWNEQQSLIDRALGGSWATMQAAIKPSANAFGVVLPDLRALLAECGNARSFLKSIVAQARPKNVTGQIGRTTSHFLLWCFLVYLRREKVLLAPLRSYYVDLVGNVQARFFAKSLLPEMHQAALDRLWDITQHYQEHNRMRIARIAQTVLLAADIDTLGDIHPHTFTTVCENILDQISASPSYRDRVRDLTQTAYDFLAGFWNETEPAKPIAITVRPGFRAGVARRRPGVRLTPTLRRDARGDDPFWYAEIPNDERIVGHPIPGYIPTDTTTYWAQILREAFPHLKVKEATRFRNASLHWLTFIAGLADPPARLEDVVRSRHINDLVSGRPGTFRHRLGETVVSPRGKNDILSSLSQMFSIYLRIHEIDARNPIEFDLDRFLAPQPRGKTPRTPLSPEMLLYLKEFNRHDDFAFSRSLAPHSWTTNHIAFLRHYRRVIDPDDGELKFLWWPGLAVLLDLMLTIPLRGAQARWLDTGEGDEYVIDPDTLEEVANPLPFAQKGRQMGVFTSFARGLDTPDRLLGLRITTNKRAVECDGRYGIPWCPDELRDSLAMMRAWQRRYNPISAPVRAERDSWANSLRSEEVTALIPQIFPLFRDPGAEGGTFPPTYQQVQTYWNLLCAAAEDELHQSRKTTFRLTRDRTRGDETFNFTERVALFDLHSLRVSGITALIEAGLPPHFVQEIVGHAAIVMTLYYHKLHPGQVNRAMADAMESRKLSLERIPEVLENLDAYDAFLLNSRAPEDAVGREMLRSAIGNGSNQVFSHGICPAGDCRTGGEYLYSMKEHQAVPRAGACSLCRYRVTGPMFLAGLVVNANKIMAELHAKGQEIARLNDEIRARRRDDKPIMAFESRRELLHRELEDLWSEWAAEHQYVEDSTRLLADYLKQQVRDGRNLPVLAADGAIAQLSVRSEHRHPFHLNQLLAEASAYVPSERHIAAIGMRDAFLNELLANNHIDPFLLRLDADTRLHAGNMLGRLLADMVPDANLQPLHDGALPVSAFIGLQDAIRELATAEPAGANPLNGARRQMAATLPEAGE